MSRKTANTPTKSGRNSTGSSNKSGNTATNLVSDDSFDLINKSCVSSYDETPDIVTGYGHSDFANSFVESSYNCNSCNSTDIGDPELTMEARENQMIFLATRLAEKQLLEGTASAQVITHYLKLGSTKERLEKEKLEKENELLRAKAEQIQNAAYTEELYINAIEAMKRYSGSD